MGRTIRPTQATLHKEQIMQNDNIPFDYKMEEPVRFIDVIEYIDNLNAEFMESYSKENEHLWATTGELLDSQIRNLFKK